MRSAESEGEWPMEHCQLPDPSLLHRCGWRDMSRVPTLARAPGVAAKMSTVAMAMQNRVPQKNRRGRQQSAVVALDRP